MDAHGEELDLVRMSFRECSRNNENEYGTELGEALVVLSYSAMGVLGQRHAWRGGGMENAAPRPLKNKYIGTGGKTKQPRKAMVSEIIEENGDVRIALAAASGVHERESLLEGGVGSYESPLNGGIRGR